MTTNNTCVPPKDVQIRLTLSTQPIHNQFTRHLVFRNHFGDSKKMPIKFEKKTGTLEWIGSLPEGTKTLREISEVNNRSYWDHFFLVNFGGKTPLKIERLFIELEYDGIPSSCFKKIVIVDCKLNNTLESGSSALSLDAAADLTRWMWVENIVKNKYNLTMPTFDAHPAVFLALRDLGKSGSDGIGKDMYGKNSKYSIEHTALCSEFVSWYYHETAVGLGDGNQFLDILATKDLHNIFSAAGNLYYYNIGKKKFYGQKSEQPYVPKPGDFLERRDHSGKPEHSMIIIAWDPTIQRAVVINGPRPVTIRNVRVHDLSTTTTTDQKRFYLGSVTPAFRF